MASRPLVVIDAPAVLPPPARALARALRRPVLAWDPSAQGSSAFPPEADVLLELRLPTGCGFHLAQALRTAHPSLRLVFWSLHPSPLDLWIACRLGAAGCGDKAEPWPQWLDRLRAIERGAPIWSPAQVQTIHTFDQEVGERLRRLRPAEWDRLQDLMRDISWQERARAWGMSRDGARRAAARLTVRLGFREPGPSATA